jgi:hypothetical protein
MLKLVVSESVCSEAQELCAIVFYMLHNRMQSMKFLVAILTELSRLTEGGGGKFM